MSEEKFTEQQRLEQLTGHRLGPYLSFNPVSRTQVWQWCSAMADLNPLYLQGDKVIAPPAMMQMWTMRDIHDRYAPGSTEARPYQVFDDLTAMGYPANVAVSYDLNFLRYLQEGERAKHFTTVVNISDKKSTALGSGFFVTEKVEYFGGVDQQFAEALITYFQYQPAVQQSASKGEQESVPPTAPANMSAVPAWQPDFKDLDLSTLQPGVSLPQLSIPITHKLIVGGAIASQDFIPVHHNIEAAQAAAMPNIFMNILTTCGLCGRYLSDWAGPNSRLQRLQLKLMAPNLPGDVMIMEAEISALQPNAVGAKVTVNFAGKNGSGYHTQGTATLMLPGE